MSETQTAPQAEAVDQVAAFASEGNQFLTFLLGDEEYGLEILRVQEIRGYSSITAVPNTPSYIKGVMNLRGTVVPVVDLRSKFMLPETEYTKFTVIIVVSVGTKVVGLVVDAVSDVLDIPSAEIEPPPELGASIDTSFMTGMAKRDESLIMLLDIGRLVGADSALGGLA